MFKTQDWTAHVARHLSYLGIAGALGSLWYGALLIPRLTRVILLGNPLRSLTLLVAIGAVLALLFKRFVLGPLDAERAFLIAIAFPLAGSILFVWSLTLLEWVASPTDAPASAAASLGVLLFLAFSGAVAVAVSAFYVIVPMGLLSFYLMRWVGERLWPEPGRFASLTSG